MSGAERRRLFWIVTAAALALRVVHILLMRDNPLFARPIMDAAIHDDWARGLLDGSWPPAAPFFRAPLYPLFLGGLYAIFDAARLPVQLVHGLVSALGAGLAGLTAARIWGRRAGYAAGLLFAGLWTSIYFSAELLIVTLPVTLDLLALWLLLDRPGDPGAAPGRGRLLLAGLALGLSAVARPNILIVLPAVAWYLARCAPRPRPAAWLALAAGLVLPILPVTLHNVVRGGDAVLIASQGGVNFYIGNNPDSDGRTAIVPGTRPSWQGGFEDAIALAERDSGRSLKPSEVDRYYWKKGLAFWRDDPGAALRLYARKLRMLVGAGERSNNKFIYCWREWSPLLRLPVWPGWALVLLLATLGLFRRDLPGRARILLLGAPALYALSILLFFVNSRFRLPVAAMLTIPAGAGLDAAWTAVRTRKWGHGVWALVIAAALCALSLADFADFRENRTDANPFHHFTLGNSYAAAGEDAAAEREYRSALEINRRYPQAHFDLIAGNLYAALGDLQQRGGRADEALAAFAQWVRAEPRSTAARVRFGDALLQAGRVDEAAVQFETALREDPQDRGALTGAAWIQLDREEPDARKLFGAGLCLIGLGRDEEAARTFIEVLDREPGYWQALGNLAGIRERQGRLDEARRAYRELLRLNPGDARVRQWLEEHP